MMTLPQPRYQPDDRISDRHQIHQALMGSLGEVYLCLDPEEMLPLALKTFQPRYQPNTLPKVSALEVTICCNRGMTNEALECHYKALVSFGRAAPTLIPAHAA